MPILEFHFPARAKRPRARFIDGQKAVTLRGEHIAEEFENLVQDYVETRFGVEKDASTVQSAAE